MGGPRIGDGRAGRQRLLLFGARGPLFSTLGRASRRRGGLVPDLLLIESDAVFARAPAQAFEPAGWAVTTVGDGHAGIEAARKRTPDAIVLAVEVPEVSGFTVAAACAGPGARRVPGDPHLRRGHPRGLRAAQEEQGPGRRLPRQALRRRRRSSPSSPPWPGAAPGSPPPAPRSRASTRWPRTWGSPSSPPASPWGACPATGPPRPRPCPRRSPGAARRPPTPTPCPRTPSWTSPAPGACPPGPSPDEKAQFFRERVKLLETALEPGPGGLGAAHGPDRRADREPRGLPGPRRPSRPSAPRRPRPGRSWSRR